MFLAPPAVSGATASCCLEQKGLTPPSAAHSTGMNSANYLFNHVYEPSVRLSQVGFSAMMKRLSCEASRLSFSISASWCGLPLPALFFPPPPMFRRRTSVFLHLFLLRKSLQRALVSPIEQRGLRCSTGGQRRLRKETVSCQGWWLEAAKRSLDPWSQTVSSLFSALRAPTITLSSSVASHPSPGTHASSLQLLRPARLC